MYPKEKDGLRTMENLVITTNWHKRELVSFAELPEKAREEFDYIGENNSYSPRFVCRRGEWWDVLDTEGRPTFVEGCDAYISTSFWDGMLFKFARDEFGEFENDLVIVAHYYVSG